MAVAPLRGDRTVSNWASAFGVYSVQITPWKEQALRSSCATTRPFRNRPQISSLDALGIRAESKVFRAAGLTSDPWAGG